MAWSRVEADLREVIAGVVWPPGNDGFVINPIIDGNGVVPIKRQFAANIAALGWKLEERFPRFSDEEVKGRRHPGAVDAALDLDSHDLAPFFVEWENKQYPFWDAEARERQPTRMARLPGMIEFCRSDRRGMQARVEGLNILNIQLTIAFEGRIIWRSR